MNIIYDEVEYALKSHGEITKNSGSMCFGDVEISDKEMVARLHYADDIFYCEEEIAELVIKCKKKKWWHRRKYWIIPRMDGDNYE